MSKNLILSLLFGFVSFQTHGAFAEYNLLCQPDSKKSPYLVAIKSEEYYAKEISVQVLEKSNKKIVAEYSANFNEQENLYKVEGSDKYYLFYDEDGIVGIDESGPFDITVIFGDVVLKELDESIHCYQE